MTITTNPARNEYTSAAGQTVFNYTFKIYQGTDLNVYVTPDGQEANDSTDLTTDYVVDANSIGDPSGGFITFNSPLSLNDRVTIVSAIPDDRTTDYQFNGDFIPETVNNDFDRTVSLVKQLETSVNRTVQFQESQQGASALTLPPPSPGDILVWNAGGTGFDNDDGTSIQGINQAVADAEAARDAAQLAESGAQASETGAANSAAAAAASEANTQSLFDDFNDKYYGALPSDPATAPSGDPSTAGDLYFNTTDKIMREYTGAIWQDITAAAIAPGAVGTTELADDAVTGDKIDDAERVSLKSGRKNYIINGNLSGTIINQRGFAGGQPAAGVYGYDRWKGDSLGSRIEQIVENSEPINDKFVISWTGGTGTAEVDGVTGLSSGDSFTLNASGNFSVIVPTDASFVQLERGEFATDFEYRPIAEELALCQRYFQKYSGDDDTGFSQVGTGATAGNAAGCSISLPVTMRVAPTATASLLRNNTWGASNTDVSVTLLPDASSLGMIFAFTPSSSNDSGTLSTAPGQFIELDAEL